MAHAIDITHAVKVFGRQGIGRPGVSRLRAKRFGGLAEATEAVGLGRQGIGRPEVFSLGQPEVFRLRAKRFGGLAEALAEAVSLGLADDDSSSFSSP